MIDDGSVLENAGTLTMTDGSDLYAQRTGTNKVINDTGGTIVDDGSPGASADIGIGVQDNGGIHVGGGTLVLSTLSPASASTLTVGVSTSPGKISVSGTATLKGTLAIATKAGYLPPIGKKVSILTARSVSGTFPRFAPAPSSRASIGWSLTRRPPLCSLWRLADEFGRDVPSGNPGLHG